MNGDINHLLLYYMLIKAHGIKAMRFLRRRFQHNILTFLQGGGILIGGIILATMKVIQV